MNPNQETDKDSSAHEEPTTASLRDVLIRNGASEEVIERLTAHALSDDSYDYPLTVMDWSLASLLSVLNDVSAQVGAPHRPESLRLPEGREMSEEELKIAILHMLEAPLLSIEDDPHERIGTHCFVSSAAKLGGISSTATCAGFHPWWAFQEQQSVAAGRGSIYPIARLWVSEESSDMVGLIRTPPTAKLIPLFG